jgi:PAS domain-containing protein
MLGKRAGEVMPQATAEQIEEQDRKLIAAGTIIFRDEHAVETPSNGTRIVKTTRLPVMDADGKPLYLISVIRDLTDRKRHEQQIAHMAGQRGIAGAEIVHGDEHAERLEPAQDGDGAVEVADQHAFGDLQLQPSRRQAGLQQHLVHQRRQVAVAELHPNWSGVRRRRPKLKVVG